MCTSFDMCVSSLRMTCMSRTHAEKGKIKWNVDMLVLEHIYVPVSIEFCYFIFVLYICRSILPCSCLQVVLGHFRCFWRLRGQVAWVQYLDTIIKDETHVPKPFQVIPKVLANFETFRCFEGANKHGSHKPFDRINLWFGRMSSWRMIALLKTFWKGRIGLHLIECIVIGANGILYGFRRIALRRSRNTLKAAGNPEGSFIRANDSPFRRILTWFGRMVTKICAVSFLLKSYFLGYLGFLFPFVSMLYIPPILNISLMPILSVLPSN